MTKNATTYTDKTNAELAKLLSDKREELRVLRFVAAGSRPKDTNEPKKLRKEIARIMTEFSARAAK
ncbi:MAG TPA: 50S ribosomal protein L29 [Candidatus Paceibacterota bacterium]